MSARVYTVSQVNEYIGMLVEEDVLLGGFFLEGEVSNFKAHPSGHLYFTLKDTRVALDAVMFRGSAQALPYTPENGMKVIAYGRVSIYEKTGRLQFYAELLEPAGIGGLYAAFEQMKARLAEEGLFDATRKRPIPENPRHIALVTSPSGAAVRDIINVAARRNPAVSLTILPVAVQGAGAAAEIASALDAANTRGGFDVIILGRGGGSIEDLWAFNEEVVARAICRSHIPVISAVGHETDITIADFAADLRAPTPSAAAEIAVADAGRLMERLYLAARAMRGAVENLLARRGETLEAYERSLSTEGVAARLAERGGSLSKLRRRMEAACAGVLEGKGDGLARLALGLERLSPLNVLKRGYAFAEDGSGRPLASARGVEPGDGIRLRLADGALSATVTEVIDPPLEKGVAPPKLM